MKKLRKHVLTVAVAVVAGILIVFWLQPTTSYGVIVVFAICFIIIGALGSIFIK